ncbi:MAG: hypothetical protein KDB03_20970 [Planctomycetales bacterium]|nr:hypothetical protein [Planctomycetales bacterium]
MDRNLLFDTALDQKIHDALQNVSVPESLQARLLAALRNDIKHQEVISPLDEIAKDTAEQKIAGSRNRFFSRRLLLGSAVAAGLSGIAAGIYRASLPLPIHWLSAHAIAALERMADSNEPWEEGRFDDQRMELNWQVAIQAIGHRPLLDLDNLGSGDIWKFTVADGQVVFVIDAMGVRRISGIEDQWLWLEQPSGGWTLRAKQVDGNLLVIGSTARWRNYLRPSMIA